MLTCRQDLENAGSYSVEAYVANPALNALCVSANRSELAPIVYETWPSAKKLNSTGKWPFKMLSSETSTNNETVLDAIFGWHDTSENGVAARPGKQHGAPKR
jgi:hypothetical protein